MSDDPSSVTPAELIDAFFHPPQWVNIGHRSESTDGKVLIVSHVELWPWRIVLRGLRANKHAANIPTAARAPGTSNDPPGSQGESVLELLQAAAGEDHHARMMWFAGWSVSDDVSTAYRMSGSGESGGSGGEIWSDFRVEFHPAVPANARTLIFVSPAGESLEVRLPV